MDEVKAMAEGWKGKMDRLASEKETAREQLASVEVQLRVAEAWAQRIEDLRSQLGLAIAEHDALGKELETTKSASEITRADAAEMVAQYRADAEAAQDRLKVTVEYMKWLSRREALEEAHARGFDLSAEIENAKRLEVEAKKLADPEGEEGSKGSGEPEDGEDPNGSGDEAGFGEDQA
nr:uncharacterized protein LOC104104247 [Nicotiana tomentosiformis]XP_033514083.1 uncharacterized protein LOC104104247 [Nicotiana tomentosiformis]XP_033514084.1 uncharacterized protein LOC104104247 [Nicotiana tomentosiformis]XP_033514085.1 uncharacterized protein LOC104104247 [Nicotiana tomentosiformis]